MILLTLAFFGLGVADLVRWSPDRVSLARSWVAIAGGTAGAALVAGLSGFELIDVLATAGISLFVIAVWVLLDQKPPKQLWPGYPLAWVLLVLLCAFALSGSAEAVSGPLEDWYSNLPFSSTEEISIDQFAFALAGGLFLLATANRIVRLVLEAAKTPAKTGEKTLPGGRLLGPLERLIVGALVLAGDPAGAAIVVAAKSLLRFPEIKDSGEGDGQADHVTEYFLVGTFTSLLLAAGMATAILASS